MWLLFLAHEGWGIKLPDLGASERMIMPNCPNYAKWADICSKEGLAGAGEVETTSKRGGFLCIPR